MAELTLLQLLACELPLSSATEKISAAFFELDIEDQDKKSYLSRW